MRIATLGPAGTFSELAAKAYQQSLSQPAELIFATSLTRTLQTVGQNCDCAVVPIENIVEGFVSPVVDFLVRTPLQITAELKVPVCFSYVSNSQEPTRLFAQFVAQGQCSEFLADPSLPDITMTASNTESLELMQKTPHSAAIVPSHLVQSASFTQVVSAVADVAHNETRFLVLQQPGAQAPFDDNVDYKTSVLLIDDDDHPGLLADYLNAFAQAGVNLTSIVSRPTGSRFGNYHFFIDCDGHCESPRVREAFAALRQQSPLVVLGSYPLAAVGVDYGL